MAPTDLARLSAPTTAEICDELELSDEAGKLGDSGHLDLQAAPGAFLDALLENELLTDALRFLAYALPKREAVWWSCRCVRSVAEEGASLHGLSAAEAWVRNPSEPNCRAAMKAAEDLNFGTSEAWAAAGACWADESAAQPEAPELPAGKNLTGHAVGGAVLLAAAEHEGDEAEGDRRRFAALAIETANGFDTWEATTG